MGPVLFTLGQAACATNTKKRLGECDDRTPRMGQTHGLQAIDQGAGDDPPKDRACRRGTALARGKQEKLDVAVVDDGASFCLQRIVAEQFPQPPALEKRATVS